MELLPRDVFTECVSFLWFCDVDRLACCSKSLNRIIKAGPYFYSPMFGRLMNTINGEEIARTSDLEQVARRLAARAVHWPMCVDFRDIPPDICVGISANRMQFTYHFNGNRLGGNRALAADMHFPFKSSLRRITGSQWRPIVDGEELIQSPFPFTKPYTVHGSLTARISCVAYFEVSIGSIPQYIQDRNSSTRENGRFNRRPCLSVGLVNPKSILRGRMPGWDIYSYGYHGDDGHFFHGSGTGVRFGPTFGEGDIVGCGIIYPPLVLSPPVLFFVKNGVFVHSITLSTSFLTTPWFPAVGIDSFAEITLNFGAFPFVFDIVEFENKQIEKRLSVELPLTPPTETSFNHVTTILGTSSGHIVDPQIAREDNSAFEKFFKNEIENSLRDPLLSLSTGPKIYKNYGQCEIYHPERLVWKPDTNLITKLEEKMLHLQHLLSDDIQRQIVMDDMYNILRYCKTSRESSMIHKRPYLQQIKGDHIISDIDLVLGFSFQDDVVPPGNVGVFLDDAVGSGSESTYEYESEDTVESDMSSDTDGGVVEIDESSVSDDNSNSNEENGMDAA